MFLIHSSSYVILLIWLIEQVGGNSCLEYSKAAAFKGVEAFLSINGEVKSKVDQQHSHLEATNNEKNMAIDVAPITNNGNLHEANDNYLPCVEKETENSDKLKVIYESAQQPHHNIDDVNRSPAAVLTERCCDEEITPLLLNNDDDDVKKTTCESNNKGWYNMFTCFVCFMNHALKVNARFKTFLLSL